MRSFAKSGSADCSPQRQHIVRGQGLPKLATSSRYCGHAGLNANIWDVQHSTSFPHVGQMDFLQSVLFLMAVSGLEMGPDRRGPISTTIHPTSLIAEEARSIGSTHAAVQVGGGGGGIH